jgi:uncharacterized protein YrrD
MAYQSARELFGHSVITETTKTNRSPIGTIEMVTMNPATMAVDGFLIGRVGDARNQSYIPLECVTTTHAGSELVIYPRFGRRPSQSRRIIGISAWTNQPRMLVGFVHDFYFAWDSGMIESFVIHQLIRKWTIPTAAIEKITPRALLIHNDTTIKLKITPFPAETG